MIRINSQVLVHILRYFAIKHVGLRGWIVADFIFIYLIIASMNIVLCLECMTYTLRTNSIYCPKG